MPQETPINPDWTIQEERLRYGAEKHKQRDTARLIWASKPRKEPSPKDLDFQNAEIVIPNKATGDLRSFFAPEKKEIDTQPNRLIWDNNLLVMQALLAQGYEGQIDLIYIDPPFNTGENFNFPNEVTIGDKTFEKEMPMSERLAYTDTWDRGIDSFLDMLYPRLQLMRKLLSENGSIYVHCDWRVNGALRLLMDEVFGHFENQICWKRSAIATNVQTQWRNSHDIILFYSKSGNHKFNVQYGEYSDSLKRHYNKTDEKGAFRTVPLMASGRTTCPSGQPWRGIDVSSRGKNGMHWLKKPEILDQLDKDGLIYWNSQGIPELKPDLDTI